MKKFFSLILVAMLSLSPIYTIAAEDTQALTQTTNEAPAEIVSDSLAPEPRAETPASAVTEEPSASEANPGAPAEGNITDGTITEGEPSQEKQNTDGSTVETVETKPSTDGAEVVTEEGAKKESDDAEKIAEDKEKVDLEDPEQEDLEGQETTEEKLEKTEEELEKERLEKELKEKEELEKLKAKKRAEIPEHVHEFKYTSNGDGTHTITCTAKVIREKVIEDSSEDIETEFETEEVDCEYNEIEECEYDENGVCKYCKALKPKEAFNPSISIAISNGSCIIGESNPIIALHISQKDFDIDYAQICFANYSQNKFINVALAQGQYYDHKEETFVYMGNSGWYASPEISDDYGQGRYSVRSVFVRSSDGETVHYSIESGNLPEGLQDNAIELQMPTSMSLIKDVLPVSNTTPEIVEPPVFDEPDEEYEEENEFSEERADEIDIPIDEPVGEETVENTTAQNSSSEEPVLGSSKTEEPVVESSPAEEKVDGTAEDTVEENNEEPTIEEPIVGSTRSTEPMAEQPKQEETPKTEERSTTENSTAPDSRSTAEDKSSTDSRSNNTNSTTNKSNDTEKNNSSNQESTSSKILKFFKSLFGLQ